jgi:hypothetical protein
VSAVDEAAAAEVRRAQAVARMQGRPARLLFAALARAAAVPAGADVPRDLLEPRPLEALAELLAATGEQPGGGTVRARGGAAPAASLTTPRRRGPTALGSLHDRTGPEGLERWFVPRRPPQDGPDRAMGARPASGGRPLPSGSRRTAAPAMPPAATDAGVARAGPWAVPMTRQRLALIRSEVRRSVLSPSGRPALAPPQRHAAPSPAASRPQVPIAAAPWWSEDAQVEVALRPTPGATGPGRRPSLPEPPRDGPPGSGDTGPAAFALRPHEPAASASSAAPAPLAAGGPAVSPTIAGPALPGPSLAPIARPVPHLENEDELAELAYLHGVNLSWP